MGITDELERLTELHRSGSLSAEEFNAAKSALLAGHGGAEAPADGRYAEPEQSEPFAPSASGVRPSREQDLSAAPRPQGTSILLVLGVIVVLFGLYTIVTAVVGGSAAQTFVDSMPTGQMPGMFGEMTITDADGRPITVSPMTSPAGSQQNAMKSAIGTSMFLSVLWGVGLVGIGYWLYRRGSHA